MSESRYYRDNLADILEFTEGRHLLSLEDVRRFTQDIESDTEDAGAYFADKDPEKPITPAQVKFFYTCASRHGFTKQEAKDFLRSHGYDSASKIKSGDFDALVDALQKEDS